MLRAWSKGDNEGAEQVFPAVYDELRRRARSFLRRERTGHTLQTTALINETYLKLRGQEGFNWESRAHFFAICSTMMRRILVDHAKSRQRAKRGGFAEHVPIDSLAIATEQKNRVDILALNEALDRLGQIDPQQARIVELKFFSGFNNEETANILDISPSSVKRDWRAAKAWLYHEISLGDQV